MPRARTVCSTPGCPDLADPGKSKCKSCLTKTRRRTDAKRGTAAQRGYGSKWRLIRGHYLKRHPICEEARCRKPATDVHHLDERGPKVDNTDANLMALCHEHHSRRTAKSKGFGGS